MAMAKSPKSKSKISSGRFSSHIWLMEGLDSILFLSWNMLLCLIIWEFFSNNVLLFQTIFIDTKLFHFLKITSNNTNEPCHFN
jgi:hypothetical protein